MISLPPHLVRRRRFFFSPAFVSSARGNYLSLFRFGGDFCALACGAPSALPRRGVAGDRAARGARTPPQPRGSAPRAHTGPRARSCPWCCRRSPGAPRAAPRPGPLPPGREGAQAEAGGGKTRSGKRALPMKRKNPVFFFFLMKDNLTTF